MFVRGDTLMKRKTESIKAKGDDGRQYTIYIYTDLLDASSFENPNAVTEGVKELRTSDGMVVNLLQKGVYQIVQTGVVVRSSSPDAP